MGFFIWWSVNENSCFNIEWNCFEIFSIVFLLNKSSDAFIVHESSFMDKSCRIIRAKSNLLIISSSLILFKKGIEQSWLSPIIISFYKQPRPVSTLLKGLIRWLVNIHYNPKAITKTEFSNLILNKREPVVAAYFSCSHAS